MSGYSSLFWFGSSMALNRGLALRYKPQAFVLLGLPIAGVLSVITAFLTSFSWWYVTIPCLFICGAFIWNNLLAVMSNLAGRENQGKIFGISQSLMSLAMFLSPLLSGILAAINISIPLTLSGLVLFGIGAFALLHNFRKKRRLN
jgi:MFS family permease